MFSEAQKNQFRSAIKSVTDMFFGLTVTYTKFGESYDTFEEDNSQRVEETFEIPCLKVYAKTQEGELEITKHGKYDVSEGYILLNREDCEAVGLIIDNVWQGNVNKDKVTIQGQDYEVLSGILLGQLDDLYSLFRIDIKKILE